MSTFSLEVGRDEKATHCHCCGTDGSTGHGFLYQDGSAHAVYYAAWSRAHRQSGVTIAIAVGEWEEGSTTAQRTCVGLEMREGDGQILLRFLDPDESPWPDAELLGPVLTREAALASPLKADFLALAEVVARQHPAIAAFLRVTETDN